MFMGKIKTRTSLCSDVVTAEANGKVGETSKPILSKTGVGKIMYDEFYLVRILESISKSDILFESGSDGKEYVTIRRDFLSNNCPGGVDGRKFENCGCLQESRQVEALKKFISKLHPEVDRLFQRALLGKQADSKETCS